MATVRSGHALQRLAHFAFAQVYFRLPERERKRWNRNGRFRCPVCGSAVKQFLRIQRPYHQFCPICRSLQRQRLLWLFIERETPLCDGRGRKMLHFAPEAGLARRLRQLPQLNYLSADRSDRNAMLRVDISAIPCRDASFDCVLCSHVLEHVPDDRQAMRELRRALHAEGIAIVIVPIRGEATDEDPTVTGGAERERRFGQADHVRVYGMDVVDRLSGSGFRVRAYRTADIVTPEEVVPYGLSASDIILACRCE